MHFERLMGSASVFLPRYATALPKILEHASGRHNGWTENEAMQAMRSRMAWAWDEIHHNAAAAAAAAGVAVGVVDSAAVLGALAPASVKLAGTGTDN